MVYVGRWPCQQNVSTNLLKSGLATIYRQGGAVYDGLLPEFESAEECARNARRMIWSHGSEVVESAGEYKARMREK